MDIVELIKNMRGFDPEYGYDYTGNLYYLDYVSKKLKDTKDGLSGAWHSNKELGFTQFVLWSITRDSNLLEQSNWQVLQGYLEDWFGAGETDPDTEDYKGWHIERFSHWACGWIEVVVVSLEHAPYSALKEFEDLERGYEDYPVLDEEHFSNMESDYIYNDVKDYVVREASYLGADLDPDNSKVAEFVSWAIRELETYETDSIPMELDSLIEKFLDENYPDAIYPLAPSPESIAYDAAYIYPAPNQLSLF